MKTFVLAVFTVIMVFAAAVPARAQFTSEDVSTDTSRALIFNDMHAAVQSLKARISGISGDGLYTQAALGRAAHEWAMARITAEAARMAGADTSNVLTAIMVADFRKRFEKPSAKDRELMANMFVTELMQGMTAVEQLKTAIPSSASADLDTLRARVTALEQVVREHSTAIQENVTSIAVARQETDELARNTANALYGNGGEKREAKNWLLGRR